MFSAEQVAVVTGASRGLGRSCAIALARRGPEVLLLARDAAALANVEAEIRAEGGRVRSIACDVTQPADVEAAFATLERCDVLVNNAGTNRPQPFLDVDHATLDAILALNVRAAFIVAQAAARLMLQRRSGAIVNMSSQMGHVGAAGRTVYCMSKHAIEGLTKAMAVELAPHGVRVNAVAPTFVETPMTRPYFEDAAFRADALRRIPMGRIGTVDEVVEAVLFLASPGASLITGASLVVDGGYTAQ